MNGYIKYFENGSKYMSFFIRDNEVLDEFNETWDKAKEKLNTKFHSKSIFDKKIHKNQSKRILQRNKNKLSG